MASGTFKDMLAKFQQETEGFLKHAHDCETMRCQIETRLSNTCEALAHASAECFAAIDRLQEIGATDVKDDDVGVILAMNPGVARQQAEKSLQRFQTLTANAVTLWSKPTGAPSVLSLPSNENTPQNT
jgi:hypothetical protein